MSYVVRSKKNGLFVKRGSKIDSIDYTDKLSKARVYTNIGHIKLSLGPLVLVEVVEKVRYKITGETYIIRYPKYEHQLDDKLWEIVELSIKEA